MELQCGNYKAHILLPLIQRVEACSVLQNTEILPRTWWGVSASHPPPPPATLPCSVQLCLTLQQSGWRVRPSSWHQDWGLVWGTPLFLTGHPSNTESGCTKRDSRSTFSFPLCRTPGRSKSPNTSREHLVVLLGSTKGHRVRGAPHLNHGEAQCAHTVSFHLAKEILLNSFYKNKTASFFFF